MNAGSGSSYSVTIGPLSDGTVVEYLIIAIDDADHSTSSDSYSYTHEGSDDGDDGGSTPTIVIVSPSSGSMIDDRTPTISATYSDPDGIDTSTVSISVDGIDKTSQATITETQVTYTPVAPLSYSSHTVQVLVSDTLAGESSIQWSFTIEETVTIVNETIESIPSGGTATVNLQQTDTGIDSIEITAAQNLSNVTLNIQRLIEAPEGVEEPTDHAVYGWLNIESNADPDSISSLTISFKVEKSWLSEQELAADQVILMRYVDGQWQELSTTYLSEDTFYVYLQAVTPGLSTFVISSVSEIEMPLTTNVAFVGAIVAVIIILLVIFLMFKFGFLYFEDMNKDDSKKKK
jgi:PGF-pre-PGF domain-containing protein